MTGYDWQGALALIRAENIAAGRCVDCGGSGVVADMSKIARDPYANRRCRLCRGSGKPQREHAEEER